MIDLNPREYTEKFFKALSDTYFSSDITETATDYLKGECRLLSYLNIEDNKEYQPGELSRSLSVSSARISSMLKSLEKKGYILRRCSSDDKRKVFVSLTENGKKYIETKRESICCDFDDIFMGLGESDSAKIIEYITAITELLK